MKKIEVSRLSPIPKSNKIVAKRVYDAPQAEIMHLTIEAGETVKKHTTPVDVVFYILRGKGTIEIGNEEETVTADNLVESPANIPHALKNIGEEPFSILVIKIPNPNKRG